jgi:uncharacterized protein YndB with AHSA1/START domain
MIQTADRDQSLDTFANYTKTLRIDAAPHDLYQAVTTAQGVQGWWSATTSGEGDEITVRFGGDNFQTLKLVDLIPDRHAEWEWIAQYFPIEETPQTDEWVGTRISFDIQPNPDGSSTLVFTHIDLTPQLACYDLCLPGWNFYLSSLTHYLEEGVGSPYIPDA